MAQFDTKFPPEKIYVTRLISRRVEAEDGSWSIEKYPKIPPQTPYLELNQLARLLAESTSVSLKRVLEIFHGSPSYLRSVFPLMTGMTPGAFLREYKLLLYREALLYTNFKLVELGKMLDAHYEQLSRNFRRKYGIAPVSYRHRYRHSAYQYLYNFAGSLVVKKWDE